MRAPAYGSGGLVALVPVKPFAEAKQRLAACLSPARRAALARVMLGDVLESLAAVPGLAGVVVVTADPAAAALARDHGARVLDEEQPVAGLNAAVSGAATHLARQGYAGLLVLPSDIPGVNSAEIAALIAAHPPGRAVSLVPAHDGQGTNALIITPPEGLAFAYGEGSFAVHGERAAQAGLRVRRHPAASFPGIAEDIDTPADLARLASRASGRRVAAVLAAASVPPRASA